MKNIFYILLFITATLNAQYTPVHDGEIVTYEGVNKIRVSEDNIVSSPPVDESAVDTAGLYDVIMVADFESSDVDTFFLVDAEAAFGINIDPSDGHGTAGLGEYTNFPENDKNLFIREVDGNKYMEGVFRAGHYNIVADDNTGSGWLFHPEIQEVDATLTEVWIASLVKWPSNMQFQTCGSTCGSGKIAVGAIIGESNSGCGSRDPADDGSNLSISWNWRESLKWYLYYPDNPYFCGDATQYWMDPNDLGNRIDMGGQLDEWHCMAVRIVLNDDYDVGEGNGFIEGFWDGQFSDRYDNLRLVDAAGVYIERIREYFSFGGDSPQYAPDEDTYVGRDSFWVWTFRDGSDMPTGFTTWTDYDQTARVPLPMWDSITMQPVFSVQ